MLIFYQATLEAMLCVKRALLDFEHVSSLKISLEKSAVTFSKNIPEVLRVFLAALLSVEVVRKHDKYLGLPTIMGRSKKEVFACLKDRVWGNVQGWSVKRQSQASRSVFIKAIIQAILAYVMNCFKIPDNLLKELESIAPNLFWQMGWGERSTSSHRGSFARGKQRAVWASGN
ncbi:hypothetical protein Salat_1164400 [Sesamum alatum]|uniref:Uncharacterized protein n=1 Tax=Sesamum alatum TaxID=300844 RepID=A0AAE2CNH1_9LAMI|nr:hypothetical protein Salat_1164400 [Sesamum alatum]